MTLEAQVTQFNTTYNLLLPAKPTLPDEDEQTLIHELILEELMELNEAFDNNDIVEIADAMIDIIYVTAQRAVTMGLPVDELLREVHRSNMSKLGDDGLPVYREDGKVIKGPNFSEPRIAGILQKKLYAAHNEVAMDASIISSHAPLVFQENIQ